MLPKYYTVRHIAEVFERDEATIRRWITEGRAIKFDGIVYIPEKDPGNNWRFKAKKIGTEEVLA